MFFFFFSSRRRHTRFDCDWSSDVCSSDLLDDARAAAMSAVLKDVPGLAPMREQDLAEVMAIESAVYSRSEEHTSELQSQSNLVCRLLLEKKKRTIIDRISQYNQPSYAGAT